MTNERENTPTAPPRHQGDTVLLVAIWVFVIGGVVAAYVVGLGQNPLEGRTAYYFMLFYGALFYLYWKRSGRVPRTGGFIGAIVGLLIFLLCGFFVGLLKP